MTAGRHACPRMIDFLRRGQEKIAMIWLGRIIIALRVVVALIAISIGGLVRLSLWWQRISADNMCEAVLADIESGAIGDADR